MTALTRSRRSNGRPGDARSRDVQPGVPRRLTVERFLSERAGPSHSDVLAMQRLAGNRAVSQALRSGGAGTGLTVQRVMTPSQFKQVTDQKGPRIKVLKVDAALKRYRSSDPDDAANRLARLNTLIARCDTYLAHPDEKAARKGGVNQLRQEALMEVPVYNAYSQAETAGNNVQKATFYNQALDSYLLARRHHRVQPTDLLGKIKAHLGTMTANERQQLVQSDLTVLQNLVADPNLPAVTGRILTELLANVGNVKIETGAPGAKKKRPWEAQPEAHTVTHSLDQGLGTTERAGALAHELTHVSVGESYDNSSFFFMIDSEATAEEIVEKAQHRRDRINELRNALGAQNHLANDQVELINSKLDYGSEDKLSLYRARYDDAAAQARRADPPNMQKANYFANEALKADTIVNALGGTALTSSLLVEYDTVINQMLVYMHMWNVPQNNPLYQTLRDVGQEVYSEREEARQGIFGNLFV